MYGRASPDFISERKYWQVDRLLMAIDMQKSVSYAREDGSHRLEICRIAGADDLTGLEAKGHIYKSVERFTGTADEACAVEIAFSAGGRDWRFWVVHHPDSSSHDGPIFCQLYLVGEGLPTLTIAEVAFKLGPEIGGLESNSHIMGHGKGKKGSFRANHTLVAHSFLDHQSSAEAVRHPKTLEPDGSLRCSVTIMFAA